jgi:hypothetical protein
MLFALASSILLVLCAGNETEQLASLQGYIDSAKARPCNAFAGVEIPVASLPWFQGERFNELYVHVTGQGRPGGVTNRAGITLTTNNTDKDIVWLCSFAPFIGQTTMWCAFEYHFRPYNRSTGKPMGIAPALDWAHVVTIGFEISVKYGEHPLACELIGPFSLELAGVSVLLNGGRPLLGGTEGWHLGTWRSITDAVQGGDSTASLVASSLISEDPIVAASFRVRGNATTRISMPDIQSGRISGLVIESASGQHHYEVPGHYNKFCLHDEMAFDNGKHTWCAYECSDLKCPTDTPPSTIIVPQCYAHDSENFCLLICTSSHECPEGSECVPAGGTGGTFCAYPSGNVTLIV